jgi:hypothetical protein
LPPHRPAYAPGSGFLCWPTSLSAEQLAAPLQNTTSFRSALFNDPIDAAWFVLTFGTDSSLTVTPGWDNVTGVGTPNGECDRSVNLFLRK